MRKALLPKYVYAMYKNKLVRAEVGADGLSGKIDFGEPIPSGGIVNTAYCDNPNLTIEEFKALPVAKE